jgi:stage V sporulation protein G
MKVTEIRIRKIDKEQLKGVASVIFDEVFVVHDIKIVNGEKGLFVAMPSRKSEDKYRDVAHPINTEFRNYISAEILKAFEE